jgi:hypothetical protein
MLTYAYVCLRMLTYADVCWRMLTYADVCVVRKCGGSGAGDGGEYAGEEEGGPSCPQRLCGDAYTSSLRPRTLVA